MTFEEKLACGYYIRDAKPKPVAVVTVPVTQAVAEVVAANPESVRVSARTADGVTILAKPQSNPNCVTVRTDLVREIDEFGRPVWDDPGGAVHEYHPWSGLRR
jgi:hypothetical protein